MDSVNNIFRHDNLAAAPNVLINGYLMDATLFHFGVLMSGVHNAWVRAVCGRLKSDYDYSIKIVYNNFPWPEISHATFAKSAKEISEETSRTSRTLREDCQDSSAPKQSVPPKLGYVAITPSVSDSQ